MIIDSLDPLINVLFENIEKEAAKEKSRDYIGASSIGDKCERKLYYKLRNPENAKPRNAKLILAANDGHKSESIAAGYLQQIPGVELQTLNSKFKQFGFFDNGFGGHLDGIITGIPQAPKTPHIWENKCCNEKRFKELQNCINKYGSKQALEEWNYQYYCQAIIYMSYFDFTHHYMTVWLSGNRDLITLRTEENKKLAENLKVKAKRILAYNEPPVGINTNPSWYECKMCEFNEFCHK